MEPRRKLALRRELLAELTGEELGRVDGGTDSVHACIRTVDGCIRTVDGCIRTVDCVESVNACIPSRAVQIVVTTEPVNVC